MQRILTPLTCVLLLGLLESAGCEPEAKAPEETSTMLVTHPLRRDTDITNEYVCQVHAIQHIELRALERGYLQEIFVDEGQRIREGQQMFQIMPLLYQAELERAQAEAEISRIEYENTRSLAEQEVVSTSELALAAASLDKAKAELAFAKVHRDLTEIKAPFNGIMGTFHVRLGSLLDEGELLTTLSDNSTVWVYFNVTEAEYLDYMSRPGDDEFDIVHLRMANGKLFDQAGVVETIEADFNNETGNIAFRATFPNPDGLLRHGQTGKVLMTVELPDALLVPQKATFEILDKKYVYVVDDEHRVRSRQIEVAEELPHVYVVASGLEEDDTILLEGLRKVREGYEIEVELQDPEEAFANLEVPAE